MEKTMTVQGRGMTPDDIALVRRLIEANPSWNRTRLSQELCLLWDWSAAADSRRAERAANGQVKDMACRSLLLKLEQRGQIILPARRPTSGWGCRQLSIRYIPHETGAIACALSALTPVRVELVEEAPLLDLFKCLLARYHYLGFSGTVGENLKYLVRDRERHPLACLLFGSAAWKCAPRDDFIGWEANIRKANLHFLTNNMRFLILPWVRVPHLASHILGRAARRISSDWLEKYSHPVYLLETFVEWDRFRGTSYQAANWIWVGQTQGRSRNDRYATLKVPVKDIYLYPLRNRFREALADGR